MRLENLSLWQELNFFTVSYINYNLDRETKRNQIRNTQLPHIKPYTAGMYLRLRVFF